jgi:excinuclease UvrABC nuclease subunit
MHKYRRQAPYTNGKTNFRYTAGKSGVYLIYKNDSLKYVGMSKTDVYKTMYRHFQSWNDPTQIRITYNGKSKALRVRVILCTPAQAVRLEKMLILKHKPKDNPNKYNSFKPVQLDKKALDDFLGTKVESCPF